MWCGGLGAPARSAPARRPPGPGRYKRRPSGELETHHHSLSTSSPISQPRAVLLFVRRLLSRACPSSRTAGPCMAAAASFKGRAIAGSFVSRVLAGKAASPRYMPREAADLFSFVCSHHIGGSRFLGACSCSVRPRSRCGREICFLGHFFLSFALGSCLG